MRRTLRLLLLAVALAVTLVPAAFGQQQFQSLEKGFQADKLYHFGDVDHVNVYNGNLIVTLPIGLTYPLDGGLKYGLLLSYNSKVWDLQEGANGTTHTIPSTRSNAGLGWLLGLGRFIPNTDPTLPPNDTYEAPDGGDHPFDTFHSTDTNCGPISCPTYTTDGSNLRLRYLTPLIREIDFPDGTTQQFLKNGAGIWELRLIRSARGSDTVSITPASGSSAQCPGASSFWTVSDSKGRTTSVCFVNRTVDGTSRPMVDRVVLPPVQGASATYTFLYNSNVTVPKGAEDTDASSGWQQSHQVPQLNAVSLSTDGSAFRMSYVAPGGVRAMLATLTLPTQGTIDYTYADYRIPSLELCGNTYGLGYGFGGRTTGVLRRVLTPVTANGASPTPQTWIYTQRLSPNASTSPYTSVTNCTPPSATDPNANPTYVQLFDEMIGTVTDPTGDYVESHFSVWPGNDVGRSPDPNVSPAGFQRQFYGFPYGPYDSVQNRFLSQEIFHCAGSCSPQRSIFVRHDSEQGDGLNPPLAHRLASQRTAYRDDPAGCSASGPSANCHWTASDSSDWDSFGHYRTVAGSANLLSGGDLRTVTTSWNKSGGSTRPISPSQNWILGVYTDTVTTENGHSATAQACFDSGTGLLLGTRVLSGSSPAGTDLLTTYQFDLAGNLVTERYYGGDRQPVSTNQPLLCDAVTSLLGSGATPEYRIDHSWQNGQMVTSRYAGMPFFSLDLTVDSSGMISASRDPAGRTTNYSYDSAGRLTQLAPPGLAPTSYSYAPALVSAGKLQPATVDATTISTAEGALRQQYQYDALGRLWREKHLQRDGSWNVREKLYDVKDRLHSLSELQTVPGVGSELDFAPTHLTTYVYDTLDRVTSTTTPDGKTSTVAYTGASRVSRTVSVATGATESPVVTAEIYDGQGRLAGVVEGAATPSPVTTSYGYDIGSRLQLVTMSTPDLVQTRAFTYDHRGLLLSEQHPELGVSGGGSVSYGEYDARGHAHRKMLGSIDLRTDFDAAERPTAVTDLAAGRTLKLFAYDSGYACSGAVCYGRLAAAARYNYDAILGTVAVSETYQYDGSGRPVRRDRAAGGSLVPSESFFFSQTYDDAGNLQTLDAPCRSVNSPSVMCNPSDRTPRTFLYGYTHGFLTYVGDSGGTPWASAITYQGNELLDTVTHGLGGSATREVWTADPSGMARPGSISMTDATGSPLWSTGSYGYDGAGNIKQIGSTAYNYDSFGRLATWTQSQGVASTITSRGYDPFGNFLFTQVAYCGTNPDGSLRCFGQTAAPLEIAGTTNHYTTSTYDGAGNVTAEMGRSYSYDPLNMMTSAQLSGRDFHYLYAADDERIAVVERKPAAGGGTANRITWTVRNFANQLLSEWTDDATSGTRIINWKEDEIWRGALLLASDAPAGPRHYALDHLGSPRGIRTSTLTTSQDFAPFGSGGLLGAGDLQFTSHERDQMEVGDGTADLPDYMHARYYSPAMGRFLSVDPSHDNDTPARTPQMWNRYPYTRNNPLRFIDVTGEDAVVTCDENNRCLASVTAQIVADPNNPAQTATATAYKQATESYWNNRAEIGRNGEIITFTFSISIVAPGHQQANMDTLTVVSGSGRSNIQMTLGPVSIPDTGTLFTTDNTGNPSGMAGIAPHESGHLLGLRDMYYQGEAVGYNTAPTVDIMRYAQPSNGAQTAFMVRSPSNRNITSYVQPLACRHRPCQ